jgi:tetratricopeptide (TPR) repeat protein
MAERPSTRNTESAEKYGRWELRLPAGPLLIGVPRDVQALIERHIDRLEPLEQDVLHTASLVGTTFAVATVAAGTGLAPRDVWTCCAELARRQRFLRPEGAERWPDGTITERYTFLHELYRQELSHRLPIGERAARHARIGLRLEAGYEMRATEIAAALAMHFQGAHDAERTLRYLQHAGQNAVSRNAPREALEYLTRALALVPAPDDGASPLPSSLAAHGVDVRLALRPILSLLGESRRALELLREAGTLAERLEDDGRRGRVWAFTTTMHTVLGHTDDAVPCGIRALDVARRRDDLELHLVAAGALEQAHYFRGEYAQVVELATENLGLLPSDWTYRCFGSVSPIGIYDRYFLIQSLAELGRCEEAAAEAAEAIRLARGTDHATGIGSAYYAATTLHILRGEWKAAGATVEQAIAAFAAGDVALHLPWALASSAWVLARLGDLRVAGARVAAAERLLEEHAAKGIALAQSWAFHALGRATLLLDHSDEARRLADRALAEAASHPGYAAHALNLLGDVTVRLNPLYASSAEHYYISARSRAATIGMRPLLMQCHLGLAFLYRRTNRRRAAAKYLAMATTMGREMKIAVRTPDGS